MQEKQKVVTYTNQIQSEQMLQRLTHSMRL